ncbi:MAG: DNA-3-methyladenine glycosylase [Candidatus Bathyarchaeia archaeon]
MILQRPFYQQDILTVSKSLLGKILVHKTSDGVTAGRIVETEAYSGPEDKAAHSSGGRRTQRNEVMYGQKGHAYVYLIYGMYNCLNITVGVIAGKPEAILIRALEPVEGMEIMAKRRGTLSKQVNLTNGPGRLCIAMGISRVQNMLDLVASPLTVEDAPLVSSENIVVSTRVGVDYAGEWKDMPWRFYIKNNPFVSKP